MKVVPYSYVPGGAYGQCPRCAFKVRLNSMRLEWSGLRVCPDCWDPRPEQLTPPVVYPEGTPRPDAQPEMPDVFVEFDLAPEDL